MKILSVVGARPQFIKLAPMDKTLRARGHEHIIVHTGQHYDYEMSKSFFDQLEIPEPDRNLEIGSGTHAAQTAQMLERIDQALGDFKPEMVLVYGDTNSTLAGALAAVKSHIPVGHVEAGYRSGDISMPEEVNRVVADRVAQLLFAPTQGAVDMLLAEGYPSERIALVGNIMVESLLSNFAKMGESRILEELSIKPREYAVLTAHRPENTNDKERLSAIFQGIVAADFPVVFPAHPRTKALIDDYGLREMLQKSQVRIVDPMNYLDFGRLQSQARVILTDSGGIQEEAIMYGVPCLTLRYNTERVLTIALGGNKMVGAEEDLIRESLLELLGQAPSELQKPPYWDTDVSVRIADAIESHSSVLRISPEVVAL